MKRLILLFLIIASHFGANAITVSGTVNSSNTGLPIANHTVFLTAFDSLNGLTIVYDTTATDSNGWYSITYTNTNPILSTFLVVVYDCQNNPTSLWANSNSSNSNFIICTSTINPCQADYFFYYDSITPTTVHFYDNSTGNPTSYLWSFGDNTSSSLQNPTHNYSSNGYFYVTLTISGSGCTSTTFDTIIISGSTSCQASIIYNVDSSNSSLVHFTSQVIGNPTNYWWTFGDGTTSSLANPSHLYSSSGSFHVGLTITGPSCNSTDTTTILIYGPCQANFSWSVSPVDSSTLIFTDLSIGNPTGWLWNFGDYTVSTSQNPTHTYSTPGIYNVKLMVNGIFCIDTIDYNVTVFGNTSSLLIYPFAGNSYLDSGQAYLYHINPANQSITITDSISISYFMGINLFNFTGVSPGSYKVMVKSSAGSIYSDYFETWLGNEISWQDADTVQLNGGSEVLSISLSTANVILPQGSSSIAGSIIIMDSTLSISNDDIKIYLMKPDMSIISLKRADMFSSFIFNNLPFGSYKILIEITGVNSDPLSFDLTPQTPNIEGVSIYVSNNKVILGIKNNELEALNFKIYPVPSSELLYVELENHISSNIDIDILDLDGRVISTITKREISSQKIEIDIANLASGVYSLSIKSSNSVTNKKFIRL